MLERLHDILTAKYLRVASCDLRVEFICSDWSYGSMVLSSATVTTGLSLK
jgi:hypothetical protein